jgi:hypothetical protein
LSASDAGIAFLAWVEKRRLTVDGPDRAGAGLAQSIASAPISSAPVSSAPVYRCYFLDFRGRVAAAEIVDQAHDDAATRAALELLTARNRRQLRYAGIELWDRERRVCMFPGFDAAQPSGSPTGTDFRRQPAANVAKSAVTS